MLTLVLAQALSPQTNTALEIYRRAVATMHAISAPEFLAYTATVRTTCGPPEGVIIQTVAHVERTSDRDDATGRVDEQKDAVALHDHYYADAFPVAPDLFLGRVKTTQPDANAEALQSGLDETPSEPLKTIAVVATTQVHYNVSTVGTDDLPNCASAINLKLEPVRDPLRYNLRDLWVDPGTARICRAVAVWRGHVNLTRVIASITLDLDADGFVSRFSTLASAHAFFFFGPMVSVRQDVAFADLHAVDESRWRDRRKIAP